jgi:hypothetical protein
LHSPQQKAHLKIRAASFSFRYLLKDRLRGRGRGRRWGLNSKVSEYYLSEFSSNCWVSEQLTVGECAFRIEQC